jgi:hypothetical protein
MKTHCLPTAWFRLEPTAMCWLTLHLNEIIIYPKTRSNSHLFDLIFEIYSQRTSAISAISWTESRAGCVRTQTYPSARDRGAWTEVHVIAWSTFVMEVPTCAPHECAKADYFESPLSWHNSLWMPLRPWRSIGLGTGNSAYPVVEIWKQWNSSTKR